MQLLVAVDLKHSAVVTLHLEKKCINCRNAKERERERGGGGERYECLVLETLIFCLEVAKTKRFAM